jgi:phage recombination protein Bet
MNNIVPMRTVEPLRPRDYSPQQLDLIRRTVAKDCDRDEFDLFMEVCRRVGLDPFRKQIYAVVYNKDKPDKRKMSIITGIDGFRGVAARNKDYRPDDAEPEMVFDKDRIDRATNPLGIVKATVRAFKFGPDGQWYPGVGVAYWDEFAPIVEKWAENDKGKWSPTGTFELPYNSNWRRMGRIMLPKCAEAQALRKGWPEDLSGIYAPEEMERMAVDVSPSAAVDKFEQDKRLALVHAKDSIPILWAAGEPIDPVPVGKFGDRASEFLGKAESSVQIEAWERTNVVGLREFWALHKGDALELKKKIEARKAALVAE